jgi:hypothetical protein
MRATIAWGLLFLLPNAGVSQVAPGRNLAVDITPSSVTIANGATRVEFALKNSPASVERLYVLTLDAPSRVISAPLPLPRGQWDFIDDYRGRSVAQWVMLGAAKLRAGESSPTLSFESRGLPTIVRSWAQGYTPPPPLPAADEANTLPPDPLVANSVQGSAVGVEPFPITNPTNLILRLITLQDRACATSLGWVKSATLCQGLRAKLQQAQAMAAQRNNTGAKATLTGYVTDLSAEYSKGPTSAVTASGYWLMRSNAEFIVTLLN